MAAVIFQQHLSSTEAKSLHFIFSLNGLFHFTLCFQRFSQQSQWICISGSSNCDWSSVRGRGPSVWRRTSPSIEYNDDSFHGGMDGAHPETEDQVQVCFRAQTVLANKLMTSLKTAVWYMCVWLFTSHKHRPSSDVDKCPSALFLACRALFSWSRTLTLLEKWSSPTSMVCQLSSTSSCSASGITVWLFLLFIVIFISL